MSVDRDPAAPVSIRPLKKEAPGRYRSADGLWLFVKSPAGAWASHVTWHTYYTDDSDACGMPSFTLREQVEEAEKEAAYDARHGGPR